MCFNQQKSALFGFFRLSLSFLFARATINQVNLAFRTTIREDTHLTLAVIPFKVEAKNPLTFCHYKLTRKNLLSFRSLQSIIPWLDAGSQNLRLNQTQDLLQQTPTFSIQQPQTIILKPRATFSSPLLHRLYLDENRQLLEQIPTNQGMINPTRKNGNSCL